jgi:hypothetical protein
MRNFRVVLLFMLALSSTAVSSYGASGTEGAAFLDIPVGAAPAALGSAYSALATDAYASVWNPAGLGSLAGIELAGQHLAYLESINSEFASFVYPFDSSRGLGVSVQYLGTGDVAGTDNAGNPAADFSSHYAAYSLAYGQKLGDRLSLGLTTKLIEAKLSDVSAHAYGFDLGGMYQAADHLRLAAVVSNLGTPLTFISAKDDLPLAYKAGAAYAPDKHWLLALEGVYRKAGASGVHAGIEWSPLDLLSIRAGYETERTKELSALAGFSTGIGLHVWGQELSYAWKPSGDLGDSQYFSLLIRFGEKGSGNLMRPQSLRPHSEAERARAAGGSELASLSDRPGESLR